MEVRDVLAELATVSPTSLSVALDVYAEESNTSEICRLLDQLHLLRPRDAPQLQKAAKILCKSGIDQLRWSAVSLASGQLREILATLKASLLKSFPRLEDPTLLESLREISRLRRGSAARQERVERWVNTAQTHPPGQGTHATTPMAFAAMMMGIPMGQGGPDDEDEGAEILEVMDPLDPEFADIHDYYRPNIKEWFSGWIEVLDSLEGGDAVLEQLCEEIRDSLPYLDLPDLVEEIYGR